MRDIAVALVIFGSLPLIFVRPHIGILMWSWIAYMVPHRLTWGFAFDFPFAMVVGVTTIAAWLISREPKHLPLNAVTILLGLFTFWISVTTVFALVPADAYPEWNRAIKILLMTFLTIILMGRRERIQALVWVIVASLGFYGLKGGLFVLRGGIGLVWGPPGGFFADNNALALALIMAIPLMRYLQLQSRNKWVSLGLVFVMCVSVAAVIGSYSRGAFLGMSAMGLFLIWKSRGRWWLGTLAIVAMLLFAPLVPDRWVDRMQTIQTFEEDGSAIGRIQAWTYAWRLAVERPLVGGGFSAISDTERYARYVPDANVNRDYHSIYFEVLAGHGFVGLGIFLALAFATYRCGSHTIREAAGNPDMLWASDLAKMIQVCMVGYAVTGAFLKLAFFDLYYHLIAIQVLTWLVVQQSKTSAKDRAADMAPKTSPLVGRPPGPSPETVGAKRYWE